jgi:predicted RNase H-like nuclease (RuvC/YqgF family)
MKSKEQQYIDYTKDISAKENAITRLEMSIYRLKSASKQNTVKIVELELELNSFKNN